MAFKQKLRNLYPLEIICRFADDNLSFRGLRTVIVVPFAQLLPKIITVPKTAVKNCGQLLSPYLDFFSRIASLVICFYRFFITVRRPFNIVCRAAPALDLKNRNAGLDNFINKTNKLKEQ